MIFILLPQFLTIPVDMKERIQNFVTQPAITRWVLNTRRTYFTVQRIQLIIRWIYARSSLSHGPDNVRSAGCDIAAIRQQGNSERGVRLATVAVRSRNGKVSSRLLVARRSEVRRHLSRSTAVTLDLGCHMMQHIASLNQTLTLYCHSELAVACVIPLLFPSDWGVCMSPSCTPAESSFSSLRALMPSLPNSSLDGCCDGLNQMLTVDSHFSGWAPNIHRADVTTSRAPCWQAPACGLTVWSFFFEQENL